MGDDATHLGVQVLELELELRHSLFLLGLGKLLCLLQHGVEAGVDVLVAKLVLEARQQLLELLEALLGERQLRNAVRNIAPLLHVVRAAEAVAELLKQAGRRLVLCGVTDVMHALPIIVPFQ